jgi:hypothetical protein
MNVKEQAIELIQEFDLCNKARIKHGAIDVQIDKDSCSKWANNLANLIAWGGTDNEIAEAYYQLESRLLKLKEKIVIEVLKNGI